MSWIEWAAGLAGHPAPWPAAFLLLAGLLVVLRYRRTAERERRETLIAAYRYAPGNTVLAQAGGPGGPAVWIRVGDGQRPTPPTAAIWVVVHGNPEPRERA
jgi:hypothetical protein